jgi:ribosomal-protein-serine acetyltransferase
MGSSTDERRLPADQTRGGPCRCIAKCGGVVFTYSFGDGIDLAMLEPWHAEQFLEAVARSRDHLAAVAPVAHGVFDLDDARRYLQSWADGHADDSKHLFGIWQDGKLIGCLQLFHFDARVGVCELGAWIAPEAEGRGLVTMACRSVIDWAILVRGISRVQWTNNPTNARSSAVARRLGMTREGVLRSAAVLNSPALNLVSAGVRWDAEVWSVLAAEWPTPVHAPHRTDDGALFRFSRP